MSGSDFDAVTAHRHFSAECFNKAWEYIEKPRRTADEDEQMLLCALTSLWHWTQRGDCGPMQRSIGHWQISRVYCLLGKVKDALHHAQQCLNCSETLSHFYKAYAHEALARAWAASDVADSLTASHLAEARTLLRDITDDVERHMVEADLATIKGWEH